MSLLSSHPPEVVVDELTVEQAHALFDRESRRLTNLPGAEFIRQYREGRIQEDAATPGVTELLMLLPFGEA